MTVASNKKNGGFFFTRLLSHEWEDGQEGEGVLTIFTDQGSLERRDRRPAAAVDRGVC